jgi:ABC-2 type transport system permease protein
MHPAISIAAKDLRQKVRDRSAIILSVLAPLGLAYLFSVMIPSGGEVFHADYAVVDLDGGQIARGLVDGPLAALSEKGLADLVTVTSEDDARAKVEDGTVDAAIVIPTGFSAAVEAGRPAGLRVIGSVNATLATGVARSVLGGFASSVEAVQISVSAVLLSTGQTPDPAITAELAGRALAIPDPIALDQDRAGDREASSATYYAASMAVLFVFFAAQFGVVGLLAERRNGTLARMLAAPISHRAVLLGKMLVSIVLGVVSMAILVVATSVLIGASWGDPIAVMALIFGIVLAASGIAQLVVGFTKNEDQAGALTSIVAMSLAVVGGSFFPLSQAPEALTQLSLVTPHGWFLRGVNDLAGGGGLTEIMAPLAVLTAIGLLTGGLGLARARKVVSG